MSKDGGPPASSFTNPSKTGWLTKHGGHGLGANWKKRWFVLDNSYLFYYKGQNDKKPVGVVCLHDYRSCRKADQKESKKSPFTFVLEKREDSDDASGRNYLIFGESEEDMTSWIRTLKKEIQSSSPSPSPAPSPSFSAARGKKGGKGKQQQPQKAKKTAAAAAEVIDDKAFDELTLKVVEAPKLTHLTAERPRMRGRRPPRKYATFHEDDTKEDGEDDGSPVKASPSPPSQPVSTPPVDSPSVSAKKGHHPIMPMKPKLRTATISNPSPPPSPKPTVAAKPSPPSAASKPGKSSLQGDESEGGSAKKLPPIPPTKPKSTSMSKLEDNTVQNGEGKKSPPVPPVKPKPTSSSPPQDEAAGKVAPQHEKQSHSPGLPAKQVSTPELAQKVVSEENEAQHDKRLKTAPVVAAKPVPKKRVPRPSGESGANVSLPAVESTETATTQPEPLQEKPAEKVEEKKEEKELSSKTGSQEDLTKPVSTTPLKFNKPPAPRKPRGATNPSPKHKPMPVPRPRTGSNISSKSDDQVMEETKKEEIEEKEPKKDAVVEEHPKKDGDEEVEVKAIISADSTPEDAPPVGEAVVAAAAAVVVVDKVVDESPPTASLNQTQEQKVEQTLNKEDTQQPTEPEKKETEEKQPEVVIEVPTEVAKEIKEEQKKEVTVSDNGTTLEEKSEPSEEKRKEMVSIESTKSTDEELKPTDPDVTSPSRRIAYENVVLNVAEDGKVLLSAQEKDKEETIKEEEKEEQKIELEEEEESTTEDKADITPHTPDSLSIHSAGAVSNHSQAFSPLSSDEYERMQPAPRPAISTTSIPPSPSISHASEEYEDMRNWGSNSSRQPSTASSRQDYELVDSGPPLSTRNSNDSLYDIPRPTASQNRPVQVESRTSSVGSQAQGSLTPTRPESQQSTTIELGELEEMAPDVPPFTAASGSISSGGSSTLHDRTLSTTSSLHGPPPERDSLGYARINKRKDEDPNGWLVEQAAAIEGQLPNTTAETLKQVREILRLARIAKMEAEEMKKEAARELELARRDRHDAGLLKKNAAEILKIAKEKLNTK